MHTLMIIFVLAFVACNESGENTAKNNTTGEDDAYAKVLAAAGKGNMSAAVRNFREVNLTMSLLTGIETTDVRGDYQIVSSMLPLDNSLSGFNGQMQVGVFRLAGAYCNQLLNKNATVRTAILPNIDFAVPPAQALAPTRRAEVAGTLINAFWQRAATVEIEHQKTVDNIGTFIAEALGEGGDSARYLSGENTRMRSTSEVLFGVCNAMLASAAVVFH